MQTDILIVGGGLSGLALADHLSKQETDFILVEAQQRLGGRILTKTVSGGDFDLGPAWFWPGQNRIAALARRFEIPVFEQASMGDLMYQDQTGAIQRGRGYASMQGSYRLAGGMGRMIDALAAEINPNQVLTNTRLGKVIHAPGDITAELNKDGEPIIIQARKIVMAMPPRVIGDTVTFEPALDATQLQSLKSVPTWMAGQAKIVAVYDEPHWRNAGLSGDAMSHLGPMVEIHDASPNEGGPYALFGFVGVPANVRKTRRDELMQSARAQLVSLFGPEMSSPSDLILQDWATVPEIARAQDCVSVSRDPKYGLPSNLCDLSVRGLHFASTETAQGFGGFLEGALEAAELVRTEIWPMDTLAAT